MIEEDSNYGCVTIGMGSNTKSLINIILVGSILPSKMDYDFNQQYSIIKDGIILTEKNLVTIQIKTFRK